MSDDLQQLPIARRLPDSGHSETGEGEPGRTAPADAGSRSSRAGSWRRAWSEYWPWATLCGVGLAVVGFAWGYMHARHRASVQLAVNVPTMAGSARSERVARQSPDVFFKMLESELRSEDFLQSLASASRIPAAPDRLRASTSLQADPETGILTIGVEADRPEEGVKLANAYAAAALERVCASWDNEIRRWRKSIEDQMAAAEEQMTGVENALKAFLETNTVFDVDREIAQMDTARLESENRTAALRAQIEANKARTRILMEEFHKQNPALVSARETLALARLQFTDEHPKIKALKAALADMEAESARTRSDTNLSLSSLSNAVATGLFMQVVDLRAQGDALTRELETLQSAREQTGARMRGLWQSRSEHARLTARRQSLVECRETLTKEQSQALLLEQQGRSLNRIVGPAATETVRGAAELKSGLAWGGASGLGATALFVMLVALADGRSRRIRSESDLEEATNLPVLATLGDVKQMEPKARELWAAQTLAVLRGHLCDNDSKALICGFISATPGEGKSTWIKLLSDAASKQGYQVVVASDSKRFRSARRQSKAPASEDSMSVVPVRQAADLPMLAGARESGPPVAIGLADWIWDWQHREQFQQALTNSRMIERLAFFVELPPYSTAAGVMLAEKVPNVIWLSGRGLATSDKTRAQITTLRRSRCGLAGAVLNRAAVFLAGLTLCGTLAGSLQAQDAAAPADTKPAGGGSLTVASPEQLADWQRRLTLGPGDILDISIHGQNGTSRSGITIGPDGRINYLQANDVMAAGLTVDELREELQKALAKFILAPQVVINPTVYRSKRYYILGNVNGRGIYALDRPITVIEAIARAKGFATSFQAQNAALQVDLPRSFLVRKAADGSYGRVAVDFEGLFTRGELKQNIPLAPDDYLFFPALGPQEIYVVGEVRSAGVVPFTKDVTTLSAIAARGGFSDRAWKSRVLVIRGSLSTPQGFIVNTADVLAARGTDFKLSNRDIVYVHSKPWAKIQELIESAVMSFAQAAVVGYTGAHVGPFIKEPLINK